MFVWKNIKTAPKNGRLFEAKTNGNNETFLCQFAPLPDGLGYYGYLKILDYIDDEHLHRVVEVFPTHWKERENDI